MAQSIYCPHCKHFLFKADMFSGEVKCRFCKQMAQIDVITQDSWLKKYLTTPEGNSTIQTEAQSRA